MWNQLNIKLFMNEIDVVNVNVYSCCTGNDGFGIDLVAFINLLSYVSKIWKVCSLWVRRPLELKPSLNTLERLYVAFIFCENKSKIMSFLKF